MEAPPVFHAGGVREFPKMEEVITVFTSLSWARFEEGDPATDKDDKMVPVTGKDIKTY
jgi:hypothetical protein